MNLNNEVTIKQGEEEIKAVSFVPKLAGKLAIVDLDTLKRITDHMPNARFTEIRDNFVIKVDTSANLEEMVNRAKHEVAFHETVNLIREWKPEEQK